MIQVITSKGEADLLADFEMELSFENPMFLQDVIPAPSSLNLEFPKTVRNKEIFSFSPRVSCARQEKLPADIYVDGIIVMSGYLSFDQDNGTTIAETFAGAVIPDEIMQPFMRMSQINPTRIRFMPHPFEYYADGHTLVKITSGILAGMEGYRIRISRDKCLVTSIGGMTVAINGIYKDSFENLDEYVRQRRLQLNSGKAAAHLNLSPLQAEIDACFFTPQNQLDILALTENIKPWVERTQNELKAKRFDDVAETALFLLEEMGSRFQTLYSHPQFNACLKETNSLCRQLDNALLTLAGSLDVATDLKEVVETQRQSLLIRFPFLPLDE